MTDTGRLDALSPGEQRALLAGLLADRAARSRVLPLALSQQRLWFLEQLVPGRSVYNIPMALWLSGPLDVAAFERALSVVVQRHETLRTTFSLRNGDPVQVISPTGDVRVSVVDLTAFAADEREAQALRIANEEARRPFDLGQGPLLRASLLDLGGDRRLFVLVMHHIVSEAWSVALLLDEVSALYPACANGLPSPLPDLPLQYGDFASWQRDRAAGEGAHEDLKYWRARLSGAPPLLELPTDRPRPAMQSYRGAWTSLQIGQRTTQALHAFSRREGVTPFMSLLAAYGVLLHRYSGATDIVVGAPVAGRNRAETEKIIGFFVNTLPLRIDMSGDPTFRELVDRVKEVCVGAFEHQDLPFERLVEELQPGRSLRHAPVFQVMFALQNAPPPSLRLPHVVTEPPLGAAKVHNGGAKVDLSFFITETGGELSTGFEYSSDLFDAGTVAGMLESFRELLDSALSDADRRIGVLPLLTADQRRQVLVEWNATGTAFPRDRSISELFDSQAARTPDAVAAVFGDEEVSYSQLKARAERIASELRSLGVVRDVIVGLSAERSVDLVVGMLAIVKAGGAYLPLDVSYPASRLSFMLDDAGVTVVVAQPGHEGRIPLAGRHVVLLDAGGVSTTESGGEPSADPRPSPDDLAYVIYTSGSTGTPKGVAVPHRAVVRLVCHTDYVQLTPTDRVGQASNSSFDAATFEIWGALLNGACIVGVEREVTLSPRRLAAQLEADGITALFLTTALFNQVAQEAPDAFRSLTHLLFGGEAADPRWPRAVLASGPPQRLLHVYGPTESTTFATWRQVKEVPSSASTVPIGKPLANTQAYVLDARMQPVPPGVAGELYIGGDGVARGYLRRPELTSERFVPNPFASENSGRLYRTGDNVRALRDGALEFVGRMDGQVKLRGFRIELGEIEAALATMRLIRDAVVLLREDVPGDRRLVAYVVPQAGSAPVAPEMRAYLKERLPDYMVPAAFVVLDTLPFNENGKIDRKALPVPAAVSPETHADPGATHDETTALLALVWEEVLGRESVGLRDNFFEIGGHSLLAARLFTRIEERFGTSLPLDSLFQAPTLEEQASLLREPWRAERKKWIVAVQPSGSKPPLFFVPPAASPGVVFAPLARHLGREQPLYGLTPPEMKGEVDVANWFTESAARYIEEIRLVQPHGPYSVGGSCFGGLMAFEVAWQLAEQGCDVARLFLVDSGSPLTRDSLKYYYRRALYYWRFRLSRRFNGRPQREYVVIPHHRYVRFDLLNTEQRATTTQKAKVWDANLRGAAHYVTRRYSGRITMINSLQHHAEPEIRRRWARLAAGGVEYHVIQAQHRDLFREPAVASLAAVIAECVR